MGSSRSHHYGLNAVILIIFLSLSILPSISGGSLGMKEKMTIGSRPPHCVNKCLDCRPCMAALVIQHPSGLSKKPIVKEIESYYLLSWKCRCKEKYFQP